MCKDFFKREKRGGINPHLLDLKESLFRIRVFILNSFGGEVGSLELYLLQGKSRSHHLLKVRLNEFYGIKGKDKIPSDG